MVHTEPGPSGQRPLWMVYCGRSWAVVGMCWGMWRSLPCCCWPNLWQRPSFTCNTCKCRDLWSRCNQSQSQPRSLCTTDTVCCKRDLSILVKLQDLSQDWKGRSLPCWSSDCKNITPKILLIYFKRTGLSCSECEHFTQVGSFSKTTLNIEHGYTWLSFTMSSDISVSLLHFAEYICDSLL